MPQELCLDFAPKGRDKIAQGNALGKGHQLKRFSPCKGTTNK